MKVVKKYLITGGLGQIGMDLGQSLSRLHGPQNVILSDVRRRPSFPLRNPYIYLDTVQKGDLMKVASDGITTIVHLASLLSASGEKDPQKAIEINNRGIENILECARLFGLSVYAPSSIAAFGPSTPRINTPDDVIMRPTTVYGISKVYLELMGEYYHQRFNVDFRSLRYPGIISAGVEPGGGTTDYAVEVFYKAVNDPEGTFTCPLEPDAALPMMYMPDCLKATVECMEKHWDSPRRVFNVHAMSFTPKQLFDAITVRYPRLKIEYKVDPVKSAIAKSWPCSLNDSEAKRVWNWEAEYGLTQLVDDMVVRLSDRFGKPRPYGLQNYVLKTGIYDL